MHWLILLGALLSLLGLVGVIMSAIKVISARRAGLDDEALRARMQEILPLNLGALFVSVLGLMLVALGIFLG